MLCPLEPVCQAHKAGNPEDYPVRTRKLKRSAHSWWLLLERDASGRLWLERRPQTGIWAGLYCPPVFEDRSVLEGAAGTDAQLDDLPAVTHVLTHRDLYLHPVVMTDSQRLAVRQADGAGFFAPSEWSALGLPAPVRKLLASI
ncbi:hypothetical protein SDC9_97202 [bioreactor metagenome]|uniref:Adenine DNA glycosylase C-terminal domain-containing protein n=1 Tax=bioreactor metagenome TaxID=1076179 RepID=A0A645AB98_9ZZZZ